MWIADGPRRTRDGFLVPREGTVPGLVSGDPGILHIGLGCRVQGPIRHAGAVVLARGARIHGPIDGGHEVVLGAGTRVEGGVRSQGRIVVQAGASAGPLCAGGDVLLLGPCRVEDVHARGDIVVVGSPATGTLEPGGRVTTRDW